MCLTLARVSLHTTERWRQYSLAQDVLEREEDGVEAL